MKKLSRLICIFCLIICSCFMLTACTNSTGNNNTPKNTFTISVSANNDSYGTVYGQGTYTEDEHITFVAVANSGYKFVKWNDNSTQNPRTIKVKNDYNYVAFFEKETELYMLNSIGIYLTDVNSVFNDVEISKFAIKLDGNSVGGFNENILNPFENQGFKVYSNDNNLRPTKTNPCYIYTNDTELNVCSNEVKVRIDYAMDITSSVTNQYHVNTYKEFTIIPNLTKTTRTLETISLNISNNSYSFNLNIIIDFIKIN